MNWIYPIILWLCLILGAWGNLPRDASDKTLIYEIRLVLDRFENGVATSIKSIDLNAATYQNLQALGSRLNGYIDKLAAWTGQTTSYAGVVIQPGQVTTKTLQIAVPPNSMSTVQKAVFNAAANRAQGLGINVVVTTVP